MRRNEARPPGDEPDPDETGEAIAALFASIPAYDVVDGELMPRAPRHR